MQILKVCSKGIIALLIKEAFKRNLVASLNSYTSFPSFLAVCAIIELVQLSILRHQSVDFLLCNGIHVLNKISDTIVVDRPAKLDLCFYFISLGNTNVTHVITETSNFNIEAFVVSNRYIHPVCNLLLHFWTLPVADNDFILLIQAGIDEAILTITMSSLVQVHKVHVNRCPRNAFIVLCCKVKQRLLQQLRTTNPHFCR